MKENKMSTGKTIFTVVVAIAILVVSQGLAIAIGNISVMIGSPVVIGNLIAGISYAILTYVGVKLWVTKFLKHVLNSTKTACKVCGRKIANKNDLLLPGVPEEPGDGMVTE